MVWSAVAVGVVLLCAGVGLAVHFKLLFELDGNARDNLAVAGADWNQIYCDHIDPDRTGLLCAGVPASGALVSVFATDVFDDNQNDDIFTGGDSDAVDISEWGSTAGNPGDKGDIEHAFAALYQGPAELILYFGMDRLANNGDAALGFWFVQDEVADDFSVGTHTDGDILVQTDWPQAQGASPRIQAYTWDSSCTNANPDCVAPSQGGLKRTILAATCPETDTGDPLCAVANAGDQVAPWPYYYKTSGKAELSLTFPKETLFEGGINLTEAFPLGLPCLSTFIAETRASNSETAALKDKLVARFDLCSITVSKEGPARSKVGDTADYLITITNDGALAVENPSIVDDVIGDLSDECPLVLAPGESCVINASYVVQAGDPDPLVNRVTATYVAQNGAEVVASASHEMDLVEPSIAFDKRAAASRVLRGATVDYTLALANTSAPGTPPLECTITDTLLEIDPANTDGDGDPSTIDVTLASGADTTVNASTTFLEAGTYTNTASVSCSPEEFTNVVEATDSVTVRVIPRSLALTVDKTGDGFSKTGDPVDYTITVTNISGITVTLTDVTDDVLGDLLDAANPFPTGGTCMENLALADQGSCTITATRTTDGADPDPLVNIVTVVVADEFGGSESQQDNHRVDLVHPDYTVRKDCLTDPVPEGALATFRITVVNTGDVDLRIDVSDPLLGIDEQDLLLGARAGQACSIDELDEDASDGCYRIQGSVIATGQTVENTVDVSATLPALYGLPNVIDKSAGGACQVGEPGDGDATRTWGFWKTHGSNETPMKGYTCHVFEDHLGGTRNLGTVDHPLLLEECKDVFGIFWASPARNSDGSRRSRQSRSILHLSQQFLAGLLNTGLDNGAAPPPGLIADTQDAIGACVGGGGCNRRLLTQLAAAWAAYNESGDAVAIVDLDGVAIPHADPRGTRECADYTIADF